MRIIAVFFLLIFSGLLWAATREPVIVNHTPKVPVIIDGPLEKPNRLKVVGEPLRITGATCQIIRDSKTKKEFICLVGYNGVAITQIDWLDFFVEDKHD